MACPNEIYFFHNFYNSFQKGSMNFQPTQIFLSSNLTYIPNGNLKLRALKRFPAVMTFLLLGWSFIQNIWSDNQIYPKIILKNWINNFKNPPNYKHFWNKLPCSDLFIEIGFTLWLPLLGHLLLKFLQFLSILSSSSTRALQFLIILNPLGLWDA